MAEEEEATPGVEFDMSFSTNARINYLLWKSNMAMENDDLLLWYKCCKNIWKECGVDMKQEEKNTHKSKMKQIEESIDSYNGYISSFNNSQMRHKMFAPPREAFDQLYEWECMLREKLDKMKLLFKRGLDYGNVMV